MGRKLVGHLLVLLAKIQADGTGWGKGDATAMSGRNVRRSFIFGEKARQASDVERMALTSTASLPRRPVAGSKKTDEEERREMKNRKKGKGRHRQRPCHVEAKPP